MNIGTIAPMEEVRRIQKIEQLKVLGDHRRLVILEMLMAGPETLSSLGKALGEHPARIRYHLKLLEKAGLVEMVATNPVRGFVEKYYRARARAFSYQGILLPNSEQPGQETLVELGSHDLLLDSLAQQDLLPAKTRLLTLPVGSLEGLIALRAGIAQLAGSHLYDAGSGEYNLPAVRLLFAGRAMHLVTLVHRQQGIMVAKGNPYQIHSLADLAQPGVVFANRNPGSGTRTWFDQQLKELGLPASEIQMHEREALTHTAVAEIIAQGRAAAGLGLLAAAESAGLDFIPLFQERFDLIIPADQLQNPSLLALMDTLQTAACRKEARRFPGYDPSHMGESIEA